MGNLWDTPLSKLMAVYDPDALPIVAPLLHGGPVRVTVEYAVPHREEYVDAFHFCYSILKMLAERFPDILAPRQVYGLQGHNSHRQVTGCSQSAP
jgi:hypothetical protein